MGGKDANGCRSFGANSADFIETFVSGTTLSVPSGIVGALSLGTEGIGMASPGLVERSGCCIHKLHQSDCGSRSHPMFDLYRCFQWSSSNEIRQIC